MLTGNKAYPSVVDVVEVAISVTGLGSAQLCLKESGQKNILRKRDSVFDA
jgi:hypothetical protein